MFAEINYYFIMKIFAAFLIVFRDSSNDSLQRVSKKSLVAPVNTLKINPPENNKLGVPTVFSSEKKTNNISSTSFILFVTRNSWLLAFYVIGFGMFHAFFRTLNLS